MIDAINWLEEQMKNSTFLLSETIDFSRLGMMGYSTGAGGSIFAGNDTRIKAVVLIAPEVEPYTPNRRVTAEDAAGIHVPVLQLCGIDDVHVRMAQPDIYAELNPPKYFIWVSEEDHWSIKFVRPHIKYLVSFLKYNLCEEPEYAKFLYGSPAQQEIANGEIKLEYDIMTTTEWEVTYQGEKYSLKILSDSTILELDYEEDLYVNLTVTGPYDTPGIVNISIPRDLVPEELNMPVTFDGLSIFDSIVENSNIIHLSLTYNHTSLQHLINVELSNIEEETESEKRGIPGFPIFAISIGIILSLIILRKVRS
jgi:hypothetical protein